MASRSNIGSSKRAGAASRSQLGWAFLALLMILLRCSPCEGRKLLAEERSEVMYFEGGVVLRASPSPGSGGGDGSGEETVATPRGFSVSGRAARLMRSVPSPGVGH